MTDIEADEFFAALANPVRLRALVLLQREGELCVCELTHALGESQPKVSRHLAQMRAAGVVIDRRDGLWVHYRINPQLLAWAQTVLAVTTDGVAGEKVFAADYQRLATMPDRPGGRCCA